MKGLFRVDTEPIHPRQIMSAVLGRAIAYATGIKHAKASEYCKDGLVYGKIFSACPLNWRSEDSQGAVVCQAAIDSNFFPLYEVEFGITKLNYDPEAKGKKIPVSEWLKQMGKTRHLLKPENREVLDSIQKEVDRRWKRIKAMSENPAL